MFRFNARSLSLLFAIAALPVLAQSPAQYGWGRDLSNVPGAQDTAPTAPSGLTVDVECHPYGSLGIGSNGQYVTTGASTWGTLIYQQTGNLASITGIATGGGGWASGEVIVPPNTGEVVFPVWSTSGPGQLVGMAKVCRGPSYGFGPELRVRVIVNGQLVIPGPDNQCSAGTLDRCMQRFHPLG